MTAWDEAHRDAHLRDMLRRAFGERPTVRFAEAARLLGKDQKTLRKLVEQGRLPCRVTGAGRRRLRREFTLSDLMTYYANTAALAPPATSAARPLTRRRRHERVRGSFLEAIAREERRR